MNVLLQSRIAHEFSKHTIRYLCSKNLKPNFDQLVKNSKVVVFMKGVPEEPRCGFSNAVVQILKMHGVQFDSHDVMENESLRNGEFFITYNIGM